MKLTKKSLLYLIIIIILGFIPTAVLAIKIPDPLDVEDAYELVARAIQAILGVVGVVVLLNFVLAGFGLITSRGNPEALKKHRDNLLYTMLGLILLFAAYAVIAYFLGNLAQ